MFKWKIKWGIIKKNSLFFQKINPEDYPKLFGQFLDAEILLNMLNVFKNFYIP